MGILWKQQLWTDHLCCQKLPSHMRASCRFTRRRSETTHGGVLDMSTGVFPRTKPCHTPHIHTHTPNHTTRQQPHAHHTTPHRHRHAPPTQHHTTPHVLTHTTLQHQTTDRDPQSFNVNAWICTCQATDRDFESVFVKRKVNAWICAPRTLCNFYL